MGGWNIFGQLIRAQFEQLTSDPSPGVKSRVFFNTTTNKFRGDNGTAIISIGGSEPASALIWRLLSNAPSEADSANLEVLDFDYLSAQEIWSLVKVPSDYLAGTQINLIGGMFATTATANKVKFKATTYLIHPASTVLGTYSNSYPSTNAEVTANATPSTLTAIGTIDLTSSSGQVNSVSVAAGDLLLIKLIRDTTNESASAAADARLIRFSMVPTFT